MDKAEKSQDWVYEQVLLSTRKTGKYQMPKPMDPLEHRRMKLEEMKANTDV